MNIEKIKEALGHRLSLNDNDDFALLECWKQEVLLLSENVSETIGFFNSCTEEEFFWLSEVFEDLIEKTQSKDLFQAMCNRTEQIENPEYKSSIITDIEYAKEQFKTV